jgi:hypothetical protein
LKQVNDTSIEALTNLSLNGPPPGGPLQGNVAVLLNLDSLLRFLYGNYAKRWNLQFTINTVVVFPIRIDAYSGFFYSFLCLVGHGYFVWRS